MTNKHTNTTNVETVAFGNGGGFTGIETKYLLNYNGNLVKISQNDTVLIKELSHKEVEGIYITASELNTYKFFKPENIYQFVELKTKSTTNRIAWGFGSTEISNTAIKFYNDLIEHTKNKKP